MSEACAELAPAAEWQLSRCPESRARARAREVEPCLLLCCCLTSGPPRAQEESGVSPAVPRSPFYTAPLA